MILKGNPNQPVSMLKRIFGNRRKMVHLFTFDDKGIHEVDESKLSKEANRRLRIAFEVVGESKKVEVVEKVIDEPVEVEKSLEDMTISELKEIAEEKEIEFNSRTRKNELIYMLTRI